MNTEQPDKDSDNKNETPELTPQENSIEQQSNTDQPILESDTVISGLDSLRNKLGIKQEPQKELKDESPEDKEEKKEQQKEEKKTDTKQSADSELPEEIEIEESGKLVKVVTDQGITLYTTEDKAEEAKKGLMLQSDYTKKTQALSEERKSLETARESFIRQVKDFSAIQEEIMYGEQFNDPEPLESEYIDAYTVDDDERAEKLKKYREDKQKWIDKRDKHHEKRADMIAQRKAAEIENNKNAESFIQEYGKEALEEIYPELMEIKSALNTTGTKPFPKDMLKYYYLGRNFDSILKKRIQEETGKVVDKIDKGVKKSAKVNRTGQAVGNLSGSNDPYDKFKERIAKTGSNNNW